MAVGVGVGLCLITGAGESLGRGSVITDGVVADGVGDGDADGVGVTSERKISDE